MRAASAEGPKSIDRNQKNINLLQKLDVLTGAMNQLPAKKKVKTRVFLLWKNIISSLYDRILNISKVVLDILKLQKKVVF